MLHHRAAMENKIRQLELEKLLTKAQRETREEAKKVAGYDVIFEGIRDLPPKERKRILEAIAPKEKLAKEQILSKVARDANLHRNTLYHVNQGQKVKRERRERKRAAVLAFATDPEVSITQPGKRDTVTMDGVKHQKVLLLYYLKDLRREYNRRCDPELQVDYTTFCKFIKKAKYIVRLRNVKREVCLCMKHQNYELKLRALKPFVQFLQTNPDVLFKTWTKDQMEERLGLGTTIYNNLPEHISFKQWGYQPVPAQRSFAVGEETTYINKLRPIDHTLSKEEFITLLLEDFDTTRAHAERACHQHRTVKELRENLKADECTVQMDFAQNWLIGFGEGGEIQSVFFGKDGITVHPAVIHRRLNGEGLPIPKSLCFVSDDRKHDAGAIFEIVKRTAEYIKENFPEIKVIHFWTDSPSSQYRNISMFSMMCRIYEFFGLRCTWSYFEASHGKGPCDGVGAAAKRKADDKVTSGKDIYTAAQFVAAGNDGEGKVTYIEVPLADSWDSRAKLEIMKSKETVDGTMKFHSVAVSEASRKIVARESACFAECCWDKTNHRPVLDGDCTSDQKAETTWEEFELYTAADLKKEKTELRKAEKEKARWLARLKAAKEKKEKEQRRKQAQALKAAKKRKGTPSTSASASAPPAPTPTQTVPTEAPIPTPIETAPIETAPSENAPSETAETTAPDTPVRVLKQGDWVIAVYEGEWFLAEVKSPPIDTGLHTAYNLNFMHHKPARHSAVTEPAFYWPRHKDMLEVWDEDIMYVCKKEPHRKLTDKRVAYMALDSVDLIAARAVGDNL